MYNPSEPDSTETKLLTKAAEPPMPVSIKGLRLLLFMLAGAGPPLAYGHVVEHGLPHLEPRVPWSAIVLMMFSPVYLACAVKLKGGGRRLWRLLVVVLVLSLAAPELAELGFGYFSGIETNRDVYEIAAAPLFAMAIITFYSLNKSARLYFDLNTRPEDVPEAYLRKSEK